MTIERLLASALVAALFTLLPTSARPRGAEQIGLGRIAWAAFECSSLASKTRDIKEQKRLFEYGYKAGLSFIAALQAGKIANDKLRTEAPLLMMLLLEGPTPDFMLGRVYENAQEAALKDVFKTGDRFNSDSLQQTLAQVEFQKRNCSLLGASVN